jgi:hypothetical protein
VSYSAEHSANKRTITSAGEHMASRPGPGEPSGFLVVPGRAEGVRGWALRCSDAVVLWLRRIA